MRRRLVVLAAATTSMVALAFVVPLAVLVRAFSHERATGEAETLARALAPMLAVADPSELESAIALAAPRTPGSVTVYFEDGTVLGAPVPPDDDVATAQRGRAFVAPAEGGRAVLVPVVRRDGSTAVVRVLVPDEALDAGVLQAWAMLAGLGALLVLGAVLVADRLGRSTVGAVRELERAADRIGGGDLDARAEVGDPPEVAAVASALHALAARIRDLLAAEREHVADLSHGVRTPLMALRLSVEALPPSPHRARLTDDIDALERAVDQVIAQARRSAAEAGPPEADLAAIAEARAGFWRVLAEDQERPFLFEAHAECSPVPLRPDEVEAVIDALLGNVFAHTPEGAGIRMRVEPAEGGARLVVEDDGPGFPDRPILDRGVSRAGSSGLGLDIARQAARRTGGDITVGRSPSGGARVDVRFRSRAPAPRAAASPRLGQA